MSHQNQSKKHKPVTHSERLWTRPVAELRRRMIESTDIGEVFECFHDQLVPCVGFCRAGRVAKNPRVEGFVNSVVQRVLIDARPLRSRMFHLPEERLWHGALMHHPDLMTTVVCFEDIHLVAFAVCQLANDQVHFFRCSLPEEATHFEGMSLVSATRRNDVRGKEGAWN
jgi:hypothetical protein